MASHFNVCRLQKRGTFRLLNCFQRLDTFLHRGVATEAVVAQEEAAREGESEKNGRKSLQEFQAERQEQAEKSVLISCQSNTSKTKFLKFLSNHGDVKKYFFYECFGLNAVVEFASRDSVSSLLESASIPSVNRESAVPFKSRLLSLKSHNLEELCAPQLSLECQPQNVIPINELIHTISSAESVEQQMLFLTKSYQLTDENIRLRFLVCSLLKDIVFTYFPECAIRPFGSSVNGFGKLGCDLDMLLDLDSVSGCDKKTPRPSFFLEYQMKWVNKERAVTQSILSVIGECLDQFGPGCVGVQKILNARCPLVRFSHQPSGFQCDLSANNRVAMKSTELLYLYGELDPRVRSLVFVVRCCARSHGITSSLSGNWITNFSLTVMVLFFLQRRSPPIIPTLDHLRDLAGPEDKSVVEGNNCTFVRDFSKIPVQTNTETLEHLLSEFFEFYATFPFRKMSLNIRKGKEQSKPDASPLYIQNPFETSLNISKNVSCVQLDRFVTLCQECSWLLQQVETNKPRGARGDGTAKPWGLATLLLPSQLAKRQNFKSKRRAECVNENIKSLLGTLKMLNQEKTS